MKFENQTKSTFSIRLEVLETIEIYREFTKTKVLEIFLYRKILDSFVIDSSRKILKDFEKSKVLEN